MRNIHQKCVDALGNFSGRTKSYSKFGLSSIEPLFFFSFRLPQRQPYLNNLHCNSLLLSQNKWKLYVLFKLFFTLTFCRWVSEILSDNKPNYFPTFYSCTYSSVIYIFRSVFLRMKPQPKICLQFYTLYFRTFVEGTFYGTFYQHCHRIFEFNFRH